MKDAKAMHRNSIESFKMLNVEPRQRDIINVLIGGKIMTCRQIAYALGFKDLNQVKPRVTKLKDKKILKECGDIIDSETRRPVMTVQLVPQEMRLF